MKERERKRKRESGPHYLFLEQVPARLRIDMGRGKAVSLVQRQKVHQPASGGRHRRLVDVRLNVAGGGVRPPDARRLLPRHPRPVVREALRPGEVQPHGRGRQVALHRRTAGRQGAAGRRLERLRLPGAVHPEVLRPAEAAIGAVTAPLQAPAFQVGGAGGGEAAVSVFAALLKGRLCGVAVVHPLGVIAAPRSSSSWSWWWSLNLRAWWAWLARVRRRRRCDSLKLVVQDDWFG